MKAFHIQHNAHIIPSRFWDILITNDKEEIERMSKTYLEVLLTAKHLEGIGDFEGVICFGDLGEDIKNADCYKIANRNLKRLNK